MSEHCIALVRNVGRLPSKRRCLKKALFGPFCGHHMPKKVELDNKNRMNAVFAEMAKRQARYED